MKNKIVIISKEVLLPEYFGIYGNTFWNTKNIDELAKKGTVFNRHYTAAPSTAMSFTSMLTGVYSHETDREDYVEVEEFNQTENIFELFDKMGYKTHVLWSTNYKAIRFKYTKCYSENTYFHDQVKFNQSVGVHLPFKESNIVNDEETLNRTYQYIKDIIKKTSKDQKTFLWIHLPHVLNGRDGYGSDIDYVDKIVGDLRTYYGDESIYITADHGHMNLSKGKSTYGFDVYEKAVRIPLITPRINDFKVIDFPTSNTQIIDIIVNNKLEKKEYVVSDTAYYAQPFRKIAIYRDRFKLIYNKLSKTFEYYDVVWDPNEENNLLQKLIVDKDRQRKVVKKQINFYPFYDEAEYNLGLLKDEFHRIWRNASLFKEKRNYIIRKLKNFKAKLRRLGIVK